MTLSARGRTAVAIALSIIATISAAQTGGFISRFVSADNDLSFPLMLAPTNTEPEAAAGTVEINVASGQVSLGLTQATPNSVYSTAFVSTGPSFQVGMLTTGGDGIGNLETTLGSGLFSGHFELTRGGILQFYSADISFTIGLTASVSTSQSTTATETSSSQTTTMTTSETQTETESTSATIIAHQIEFQVDPPFRSIDAGKFAKFNIRIETQADASILLVARNIPSRGVAIFTPNLGVANPQFHSTLTIVTATDTPPGTYGITILALVNGEAFNAQVALEVRGGTVTETSTAVSVGGGLSLALSTDKHHYEPNSTVNLQGYVTDDTGSAVADAAISVQVDGPAGTEVTFVKDLKTDTAGVFRVSFKLPADATLGTYTAFATANKAGHGGATTHTTFVVGTSSTPSVVIKEVYVTDSAGDRSAVFSAGQTVLVWVIVENSGAAFEGVIWVQIRDPNGVPVSIQLQITTLNTGATVKVAFGFTLLANPSKGLYTANALVSDKLISQGGAFFASADTQFALSG